MSNALLREPKLVQHPLKLSLRDVVSAARDWARFQMIRSLRIDLPKRKEWRKCKKIHLMPGGFSSVHLAFLDEYLPKISKNISHELGLITRWRKQY